MARGRPSKKAPIAEAAQRIFRVSGYQGTTIDQVVIEAGVSKPTVYSNYPSKLLLWQEVLHRLIESSCLAMQQAFFALEQADCDFSAGWQTLWQTWADCPDRLAAYRIHWGESHKLTDQERALFRDLEDILVTQLRAWMLRSAANPERYFLLNAVSREAYLIPLLSQTSADVDLTSIIQSLSE